VRDPRLLLHSVRGLAARDPIHLPDRLKMRALSLLTLLVSGLPLSAQEPTDPYLWLEEVESETAIEWARVRSERTRASLTAQPVYDSVRAELTRLVQARRMPPNGLGDFAVRGEHIDDYWRTSQNSRGVWRRTTVERYLAGEPKWRTLVDMDSLSAADGIAWSIGGTFCLPPEMRHCMIRLSRGGADVHRLRELDAERGEFVEGGFFIDEEQRHKMRWVDANTVLVGTSFRDRGLGSPTVARLWRRGTALENAPVLLEIAPTSIGIDFIQLAGEFVIAELGTHGAETFHLLRGENELLTLDVPPGELGMVSGQLTVRPRVDWTMNGTTYPASAVLAIDWNAFLAGSRDFAVVVAPDDRTVVNEAALTRSSVVVRLLRNVRSELHEYRFEDGLWSGSRVPAPDFGVVALKSASPWSDTYIFSHESALDPLTIYARDGSGEVRRAFSVPNVFDTSGFMIEQLETTSKDGTRVPYFVIRSRTLRYDGRNPTRLYGYGGYGHVELPTFTPAMFPWLARGGVSVIANIRGGGEFGPAWHEAGTREKRQNTYDDFFAIAEDLIRRKITSPPHLGIVGGSNGGTLMGVAVNQRPELFGAALASVPVFDLRRQALIAGGDRRDEVGDPNDPADWEFLRRFSPYHNVSSTAEYPPFLITSNRRDDRVPVGNARKMVARLEEMGHEVLYLEAGTGGHGVETMQQGIDGLAVGLTFLLSRLHPAHTPVDERAGP
jgi:prolyl oligopeptidase